MARFGLLKLRPFFRKLSLAPSPASIPANSSVELSESAPPITYPSCCLYCPKQLGSEAARSKHLAMSQACKALVEKAKQAARQKQVEGRERGEPLDLHAQARACTQACPPCLEEPQKRRRLDDIDDMPVNRQTSVAHEPPQLLPPVASQPCSKAVPHLSTGASTPGPTKKPGAAAGGQSWVDPTTGWYIEPFPNPLAGAPITDKVLPPIDLEIYMRSCGEMGKPDSFEMAELLLTTGLTDAAKNQHLKSVLYLCSTIPWKNTDTLYKDVDHLRHGPAWNLFEINIQDQKSQNSKPHVQYLVARNIIHVIRDMMGNPAFRDLMRYAPEKHWTTELKTERVFDNMWSANWWARTQEKLAELGKHDATLAPLIIATDQTRLSNMCGGQKAYPVYVTLGNIGKEARRQPTKRATVLLGYLPVEAFEDITDDDERRRMKADLIHQAMETMLAPLKAASKDGVEMWCSDGRLRRVFPMVAAYLADWPEQNIQSCTSEGSCPVCSTKRKGRGELSEDPAPLRDRDETLNSIRAYFQYRSRRDLEVLSLKPVWPWWGDLEHVNLATCMTPDLLHQIYQGIFKTHLLRWLQFLVGIKELDWRFASMTQAAGMRHFAKGVSHVKQWTGRESKEMIKQILPLVAGDLSPELTQLIYSAVDFIYRAHASSMTDSDINELDATLGTFHQLKELMVSKGFYESAERFDKIPKLHMLGHYSHSIRELGTPDGYNTEAPEHLHIEYAKDPWRASNKVRPMKQMITHIQRMEAIRIQRTYTNEWVRAKTGKDPDPPSRCEHTFDGLYEDEEAVEDDVVEVTGNNLHPAGTGVGDSDVRTENNIAVSAGGSIEDVSDNGGEVDLLPPDTTYYPDPHRQMAKSPTKPNLRIKDVILTYGAPNLIAATTDFLVHRVQIPQHSILLSNHNHVHVWHRLYLHQQPLPFAPLEPPRRDVVRASPTSLDAAGRVQRAGFWDTVLYRDQPNRRGPALNGREKHGMLRYRSGRVRAMFTLPGHLRHYYPGQLAYLELFTSFDGGSSPFHGLKPTRPDFTSSGQRRTLVVPVTDIYLACHLSPNFKRLSPELKLNARTDLFVISKYFWFNHFYSHYMYLLVRYWQAQPPPRQCFTLRERLARYNPALRPAPSLAGRITAPLPHSHRYT